MITDKQKQTAKEMHEEANRNGWEVVTFFQDKFFTSKSYFGYPVCIQLINRKGNCVATSRILQWSQSKVACENVVREIDAFIATLDGEAVHGHAHIDTH